MHGNKAVQLSFMNQQDWINQYYNRVNIWCFKTAMPHVRRIIVWKRMDEKLSVGFGPDQLTKCNRPSPFTLTLHGLLNYLSCAFHVLANEQQRAMQLQLYELYQYKVCSEHRGQKLTKLFEHKRGTILLAIIRRAFHLQITN